MALRRSRVRVSLGPCDNPKLRQCRGFFSKTARTGNEERKAATVSKHKQTIWDDLVEIGREVLEKIDALLHPEKQRKPVRVPVPVRGAQPPQDPYDDSSMY